jgi:hypothetical protein
MISPKRIVISTIAREQKDDITKENSDITNCPRTFSLLRRSAQNEPNDEHLEQDCAARNAH